jgi:hypothetical protein
MSKIVFVKKGLLLVSFVVCLTGAIGGYVTFNQEAIRELSDREAQSCQGMTCPEYDISKLLGLEALYDEEWTELSYNTFRDTSDPNLDGTLTFDAESGFWKNKVYDSLDVDFLAEYDSHTDELYLKVGAPYGPDAGKNYSWISGNYQHRIYESTEWVIDATGSIWAKNVWGLLDGETIWVFGISLEFKY